MDNNQDMNVRVEAIIDNIGDAVNGNEFDVVMNALVYMVAHGAVSTGIDKETFMQMVTDQLSNLYDYINEVKNGNGSIR